MATKNYSKLENNIRIWLPKWVCFQFLSESWQRWGRETVPELWPSRGKWTVSDTRWCKKSDDW